MGKAYEHVTRFTTSKLPPLFLLLLCALFIFVMPVIEDKPKWVSLLVISAIIAIAASSISQRTFYFAIAAIVIETSTNATGYIYHYHLAEITTNLFIIYIVVSVVLDIMKKENVTILTLVEAVNGYLLLGIMFLSLVSNLEGYNPGSFSGSNPSNMYLTYYTMVTLTTTGYGDITPQTPMAQSLSLIISITGQFYVAVIVAIIVGKYSNNSRNR